MDNQQDQFGTPNSNTPGRNSQNPAATPSPTGAPTGATARKSAPIPANQGTKPVSDSINQTPASAEHPSEGPQPTGQNGTLLDTTLNSGKKWIENSGVLNGVNQLPQNLKDFGSRALDRVNSLSTTQKVVSGAILAAGIGWLATRKGKSSLSDSKSSLYNYGRQRDTGSYGRSSYGYQAPDASTSRRTDSGAANRTDSGSPYGDSGSRYGNSTSPGSNTGIQSGSGRSDGATSPSASANTDHGARTTSGSHQKDDYSRSGE